LYLIFFILTENEIRRQKPPEKKSVKEQKRKGVIVPGEDSSPEA
jgi:hypothetical protein